MGPTTFTESNSNRLLSPAVWRDFPRAEIAHGYVDGVFVFDDFIRLGGFRTKVTTPHYGMYGPYSLYTDSTAAPSKLSSVTGGVLRLTTPATDNDEIILGDASFARAEVNDGTIATQDTGGGGLLSMSLTAPKLTIFECRFKMASATVLHDTFIGLGEEAMVLANTFLGATSYATTASDHIGFRIEEGDPDGMDFVWAKNGQTEVVNKDVVQAITADTWYKFGFRFDPKDNTIRCYVGGTESNKTLMSAVTTATFPNTDIMGLIYGTVNRAGTARTIDLDWWAVGQVS